MVTDDSARSITPCRLVPDDARSRERLEPPPRGTVAVARHPGAENFSAHRRYPTGLQPRRESPAMEDAESGRGRCGVGCPAGVSGAFPGRAPVRGVVVRRPAKGRRAAWSALRGRCALAALAEGRFARVLLRSSPETPRGIPRGSPPTHGRAGARARALRLGGEPARCSPASPRCCRRRTRCCCAPSRAPCSCWRWECRRAGTGAAAEVTSPPDGAGA